MFNINYKDSRPIYEQIKQSIKKMIINGMMNDGDKLPSVRELAGQLTINPNTIQRAYAELESENYIYSVAGKGSFVRVNNESSNHSENNIINAGKLQSLLKKLDEILDELTYAGITADTVIEHIKGRTK